MPESKQSPCVLCDTMAQFEHHDGYQTRYYECKKCRYYAITERAVRHLKEHPEDKPALAQKAAKMPHDTKIIKITYRAGLGLDPLIVARTKYSQ